MVVAVGGGWWWLEVVGGGWRWLVVVNLSRFFAVLYVVLQNNFRKVIEKTKFNSKYSNKNNLTAGMPIKTGFIYLFYLFIFIFYLFILFFYFFILFIYLFILFIYFFILFNNLPISIEYSFLNPLKLLLNFYLFFNFLFIKKYFL